MACGEIPCGMRTTFTQIRAIRVDGTTSEVEGLTAERARRSIIRVLDGIPLGAWATITSGGEAHVNTAYYSHSEDSEAWGRRTGLSVLSLRAPQGEGSGRGRIRRCGLGRGTGRVQIVNPRV
jgi:hypothetical protein